MGSRTQPRCRAFVVLMLLGAAAIPATSTATSNSAPPRQLPIVSTFGRIHMVGFQEYGAQPSTAADFARIASMDDMVIAQPLVIDRIGPTLKADNPNITLLVYENGMYSGTNDPANMPRAGTLHTASGKSSVVHTTGGGTLMNPRSTAAFTDANGTYDGWPDYVAKTCARHQLSFTSGCYVDMLGPSGIRPLYNLGGAVPWTRQPAHCRSGDLRVADRIHSRHHPRGAARRGHGHRKRLPEWARVLHALDGHAERVHRRGAGAGMADARGIADFGAGMAADGADGHRQRSRRLLDDRSLGLRLHELCADRCQPGVRFGDVSAGQHRPCLRLHVGHVTQRPRLAALLLAVRAEAFGSPTQTLPTVADYLLDGVYQRAYSGGRVLVNPGTTAITVSLNGTYYTLGGTAVRSIRVAAHSAQILTD